MKELLVTAISLTSLKYLPKSSSPQKVENTVNIYQPAQSLATAQSPEKLVSYFVWTVTIETLLCLLMHAQLTR